LKFIDWVYTKENFTGVDSGFILSKFVWFYTYVFRSDVSHIDNFSTSELFKLLFQRRPSLLKRLNVSGPKTFPIGHDGLDVIHVYLSHGQKTVVVFITGDQLFQAFQCGPGKCHESKLISRRTVNTMS